MGRKTAEVEFPFKRKRVDAQSVARGIIIVIAAVLWLICVAAILWFLYIEMTAKVVA